MTPRETGGPAFYGWEHAQFLVEAGMLDPARLLVLDVAGLEAFLEASSAKPEEPAG